MKKYFLWMILCLSMTPLLVNAANCSTTNINTEQYRYYREVTGTIALNAEVNYPAPQYVTSCCNVNDKYICDIYQFIEKEETSSSEEPKTESPETTTGSQSGSSGTGTVNYCQGLKSTLTLVGHIVFILKIAIPIIIIAFGIIDFLRAVLASKDDEIKKSMKSLLFRCIAGVIIFFLPAFIDVVFSWVNGWQENYENKYKECFQCIWNVNECTK